MRSKRGSLPVAAGDADSIWSLSDRSRPQIRNPALGLSEARFHRSEGIARTGHDGRHEDGASGRPILHDEPSSKHRQSEADHGEAEDQEDTGQGFRVRRARAEAVRLGGQPDTGDKADCARDHQHDRSRKGQPAARATPASDRSSSCGHGADGSNMAFNIGPDPGRSA